MKQMKYDKLTKAELQKQLNARGVIGARDMEAVLQGTGATRASKEHLILALSRGDRRARRAGLLGGALAAGGAGAMFWSNEQAERTASAANRSTSTPTTLAKSTSPSTTSTSTGTVSDANTGSASQERSTSSPTQPPNDLTRVLVSPLIIHGYIGTATDAILGHRPGNGVR